MKQSKCKYTVKSCIVSNIEDNISKTHFFILFFFQMPFAIVSSGFKTPGYLLNTTLCLPTVFLSQESVLNSLLLIPLFSSVYLFLTIN